jgi:hypothetical protein
VTDLWKHALIVSLTLVGAGIIANLIQAAAGLLA